MEDSQITLTSDTIDSMPQNQYVNFKMFEVARDDILLQVGCKNCLQLGHIAKGCTNERPTKTLECFKCGRKGHSKIQCDMLECKLCVKKGWEGQGGRQKRHCPKQKCCKCFGDGHIEEDCKGPERRECQLCHNVGHLLKDCKGTKFGWTFPSGVITKKTHEYQADDPSTAKPIAIDASEVKEPEVVTRSFTPGDAGTGASWSTSTAKDSHFTETMGYR